MFKIAVLSGDGVGPEVIAQALRILQFFREKGLQVSWEQALLGFCAYEATNEVLPEATFRLAQEADAILLGAVGSPAAAKLPAGKTPEAALLRLRKDLELFANLRPVKVFPSLLDASPLKREVLEGVDLMLVRELTSGIYFGTSGTLREDGKRSAFDTCRYDEEEISRVARVAFSLAARRKNRLCLVDKANVLATSRLWREVISEVSREFPSCALSFLYVDAAAMELMRRPASFDVVLTENLFGDILSDEAGVLAGSLGMLPSASLGASNKGLYEPVHGSAPDIAGKGIANPVGAILSLAMLLRHSLRQEKLAGLVEEAVQKTLASGVYTADIAVPGAAPVSTSQMGDAILAHLTALFSSSQKGLA